jgi:isopentenyl-diphosphate delta-isomerase
MTTEIIIPAIAEDGSLYPIEKMKAHERGQQHLAISAFVFSGSRLLIQQRSHGKYHCPGKWANTCCSHPHWNESVEDAARRRIKEELGFELPLKNTATIDYRADVGSGLVENERVSVFVGHADEAALKIAPNPDEVAATKWVDVNDLSSISANEPDTLCPWFAIYISRWKELNLGV